MSGGATWILQTGEEYARSLAVLEQDSDARRFLVDADKSALDYAASGREPHFYLLYWYQAPAQTVFDALREDKPLPDKYQR